MAIALPKIKEEIPVVQPAPPVVIDEPPVELAPPVDKLPIEETNQLTTEIIENVESPQIAELIPFPEIDTFYTAVEALKFGADLPEGWQLKVSPVGGGTTSIIDPRGWEHLAGDVFISPEGTPITLAQVKVLMDVPIGQRIGDFPTLPMILGRQEAPLSFEAIAPGRDISFFFPPVEDINLVPPAERPPRRRVRGTACHLPVHRSHPAAGRGRGKPAKRDD